jgi:hypothetical protein
MLPAANWHCILCDPRTNVVLQRGDKLAWCNIPLASIINGTSNSTVTPDTAFDGIGMSPPPRLNLSIASIVDAADRFNSSFTFGSIFRRQSSWGFGDSVEGSSVGAGGYMGLLLGGGIGLLVLAAGIMYWHRRRAAAKLNAAMA